MSDAETPRLVDSQGKPIDRTRSKQCPQCGAAESKRTKSSGFGIAHPVCSRCGYEWMDEVWRD